VWSSGGLRLVLIPIAISLGTPAAGLAAEPDYAAYGDLLARYVMAEGVRYEAWRGNAADVGALRTEVGRFSGIEPQDLQPAERYALYINLYNAKVLEIVLDGNPEGSIKKLSKGINPYEIFKRKMLDFDGENISLTTLETRLRQESNDPRIHFAVNCASRSCPPIATEPFRGATLDAQLDQVTRTFLASPGAVETKATSSWFGGSTLEVTISKIFDWYSGDFDLAGGVPAFLAAHSPSEVAGAVRDAGKKIKLRYRAYDWSLNDAP
jgi:hypothetical protein